MSFHTLMKAHNAVHDVSMTVGSEADDAAYSKPAYDRAKTPRLSEANPHTQKEKNNAASRDCWFLVSWIDHGDSGQM